MQIGELSRRTGVSVRMLRYYEEEGLLQPSRRDSGYRDYGPAEEQLVRRIRVFSDAGLKLHAIRTLLPCVLNDRPELELCNEVRATLNREIGGIEERIACLESSRDILVGYLRQDAKRPRIGVRLQR
ncbi:MerR family transcriptional regulator [Bradyrhizobium sp. INPA01-394B]|uniref:MerR family transcriptional regulator n=1 Tax=Bradyrhizobium campsiandrae TaxID=1729892 RepID=A0ABR7U8E0_9BRAD|nr:MerR family transcriptional regulator [Bradyrhizobium campsiandrae]MBC9878397.1 MerR family transcriptional regulator [Bradyrhizobium campsiandrae]MBC9980321.1 MerR family transcriptional regulator [Bradyrhizobium campsiandrae]